MIDRTEKNYSRSVFLRRGVRKGKSAGDMSESNASEASQAARDILENTEAGDATEWLQREYKKLMMRELAVAERESKLAQKEPKNAKRNQEGHTKGGT